MKVLFGMALRPHHLATMERLPPPKPRRDLRRIRKQSGRLFSRRSDALCEAAGAAPLARDIDRQVAEFQVRVAVLNGIIALGTPVTNAAG